MRRSIYIVESAGGAQPAIHMIADWAGQPNQQSTPLPNGWVAQSAINIMPNGLIAKYLGLAEAAILMIFSNLVCANILYSSNVYFHCGYCLQTP